MKRILTFVLVALAGMTAVMAQRSNHFTVDLNFSKTTKGGGYAKEPLDAWGISATGGYRFYLVKGLYITPEATLYYENHDHGVVYGTPETEDLDGVKLEKDDRDRTSEAGIGLGGMVGCNLICDRFYTSIDIFTGPYFDCALVQKDDWLNRPSFKWRFGAAVSFSRVYIKASIDLALTNLMDDINEHNAFNVGVGYHF